MKLFKIRLITLLAISSVTAMTGCDEAEMQDQNAGVVDSQDDAEGDAARVAGALVEGVEGDLEGHASQTDLDAIAAGPPSEANREDLDLTSASRPQFAGWVRVCAASLTLRNTPGGNTLGTLYNGYWFYKSGTNGSWSSGYSNELGIWGWVLTPYLC